MQENSCFFPDSSSFIVVIMLCMYTLHTHTILPSIFFLYIYIYIMSTQFTFLPFITAFGILLFWQKNLSLFYTFSIDSHVSFLQRDDYLMSFDLEKLRK